MGSLANYLSVLLVIAAVFCADSEAVVNVTQAVNTTANDVREKKHGNKFLRGHKKAHTDTDEERATAVIGTTYLGKDATRMWLENELAKKTSIKEIFPKLLWGKSLEDMATHPNFKAYAKYVRMFNAKNSHDEEVILRVDGLKLNKEQTKILFQELLNGVAVNGKQLHPVSPDDMAEVLGVLGLSKAALVNHHHWRAYKLYEKMYNDFMKKPFAKFVVNAGGTPKTLERQKEVEEQLKLWALEGEAVKDVEKTLKLDGLTPEEMKAHLNFAAYTQYNDYYLIFAPIRAHIARKWAEAATSNAMKLTSAAEAAAKKAENAAKALEAARNEVLSANTKVSIAEARNVEVIRAAQAVKAEAAKAKAMKAEKAAARKTRTTQSKIEKAEAVNAKGSRAKSEKDVKGRATTEVIVKLKRGDARAEREKVAKVDESIAELKLQTATSEATAHEKALHLAKSKVAQAKHAAKAATEKLAKAEAESLEAVKASTVALQKADQGRKFAEGAEAKAKEADEVAMMALHANLAASAPKAPIGTRIRKAEN